MTQPPTTYWDYIKTEQLLALQTGLETDERDLNNDEVVFITVHQIDELWFKLILRELQGVRDLFAQPHVPEQSLSSAVRGLRRVSLLFRSAAQHFELMETLTTRDYLGFRDKLLPASGFQSAQMREIEILLGLDDRKRVKLGGEYSYLDALKRPDGEPSPAHARVMARLRDTPTFRAAIHAWLHRTPIEGSRPDDANDVAVVDGFLERYCQAQAAELTELMHQAIAQTLTPDDAERLRTRYQSQIASARAFLFAVDEPEPERDTIRRIRAALVFIESYRELPLLAWPREVIDTIVALEQASLIFRQRHARMVERVIGRRVGTGGSSGVDYLDSTALAYRVFDELWMVRTLLIRKDALPPLHDAGFYEFAENPASRRD